VLLKLLAKAIAVIKVLVFGECLYNYGSINTQGEVVMKKLMIAVGVLLLLIIIAVVVVASQAGSLIKNGVESYGPDITGTSVTLSGVDVSLLSGSASINNLVIGNPKGFKSNEAFRVGEVAVKLDVGSLFSEQVRIEKILIDGAELTYEQVNKSSNIDALRRNVEKNTGADSGSAAADEGGSSNIQLLIDDLFINNTKVNVSAKLLDREEQRSVTIPDIHLKDLGQGGNDSSVAAIVDEVVRLVTKAATKAVVDELGKQKIQEAIDKKKGEAMQKLDEKLGDKLKDLF